MVLIIKNKRSIRNSLLPAAIILAVLLVAIIIFVNAGSWLVVEDELQPADAIVVLMGSPADRMLEAYEIYNSGYADKVLMVNTHVPAAEMLAERGVHLKSNAEISREIGLGLGFPEEVINILPGEAQSTRDEAGVIVSYLRDNNEIDEIILVTSSYQTRRYSAIFKRAFSALDNPPGIIAAPSRFCEFNAERWYTDRQSAKRVVMEYLRLFYFMIWERWLI